MSITVLEQVGQLKRELQECKEEIKKLKYEIVVKDRAIDICFEALREAVTKGGKHEILYRYRVP